MDILQPLEPELGNTSGGKRRDNGIAPYFVLVGLFKAAFFLKEAAFLMDNKNPVMEGYL